MPGETIAMIRIDLVQQNTNHFDKRRRHQGRAICEVAGRRFGAQGPAPIYRMATLLWLHGHGGEAFEVLDDLSPFGKPGGLAMTGRVRNWASFQTPNGKPMFRMNSQPDPDLTPEQRATVAKAAGVVVSMDANSRGTFAPGCAAPTLDGPEYPQKEEGASTRDVAAQNPEAA